ncbi:MAG TPA: glycosyltransferase 87 family protein [Trebonia sp.]|nr:glycosyltransferase 87 family protein [Trebonia sp.]
MSPAAMPLRWLAGIFAVSAVYAWLVVIVSSDSVHRTWGEMAACGYAIAFIVLLAWKGRGRDVALGVSLIGGLLAPLSWMISKGLEQPEVAVVARSGAMLIHHGTPYASTAALATTTNPNAYNPYLPVMALFGVPRALADSAFTDPRIWFGLAFVCVFWLALRRAGAKDPLRWTVLVTGCPVIAFTLATGGDDVPIVAFLCLGLAFLWGQPSPVLAGLALGVAAAMKATTWPALAVVLALLAARDGKRAAVRFILTAVAVVVVTAGPFLIHPGPLIENTIRFPLGLANVISAAASPLPGHLIADTGHTGHTIVVVLLVLAGLAVAGLLVFRPPRTVPRATLVLVVAMTLMFLLAPSTRYGYFIYPMALLIWLLAAVAARQSNEVTRDPGEPPANSCTNRRTSSARPPAA